MELPTTPAQRLDALCGALAYRVGRQATCATVLDLARIVRDIHRDAQAPQETPEPLPVEPQFKVGDEVVVSGFGPGDWHGVIDDMDGTEAPYGDGVHVIRRSDSMSMWVPTRFLRRLNADPTLGPVDMSSKRTKFGWTPPPGGGYSAISAKNTRSDGTSETRPPTPPKSRGAASDPGSVPEADAQRFEVGGRWFTIGDPLELAVEGLGRVRGRVREVDIKERTDGITVTTVTTFTLSAGALNAEPSPAPVVPTPVVLPTTPGSVAWTRDGGIYARGDQVNDRSWSNLAPRMGYIRWQSPVELLDRGVVRTFDAGTGQVREFDAGTGAA